MSLGCRFQDLGSSAPGVGGRAGAGAETVGVQTWMEAQTFAAAAAVVQDSGPTV